MSVVEFQEFYEDFLTESTEHLEQYEHHLLHIETVSKSPSYAFTEIEESVQAIFRAVHTIKSLAGMMGFPAVSTFAHEAEDFLDLLRNESLRFNPETIDLTFAVLDAMKELVAGVSESGQETSVEISAVLEKVRQFSSVRAGDKKNAILSMDNLVRSKTAETQVSTLRVDTKRIDELMAIVGELVIGKNRLVQADKKRSADVQGGVVEFMTRLISHLQDTAIRLRMVPVGQTFGKYNRMVRDLAKNGGKEIVLSISGHDTEVDRSIIELMEDPLMHILRNAVDHGLETPDDREAAGKSREGSLALSASQENNMIVIQIKDDGRGMDPESLFRKAVAKGFVDPSMSLTDKEKLGLIFLPGFSTASQVSDVSGRGVGMDVVRKNIMAVNGRVDVESVKGIGTTFTIQLPLTLAIIPTLLVRLVDANFAIPLSNIVEIVRITPDDVLGMDGMEVIKLRDEVLPLVRLNQWLLGKEEPSGDRLFIVVVGFGESKIACVVDDLLEQQDVVIKPLGEYLKKIEGVAGATVLSDGQVGLVLDIPTLFEKERRRASRNSRLN